MKRHLFLLIIAMLFSIASAVAQDCDYSGTTGELEWCLKDGTLTISGEGEMPDYIQDGSPWFEYRDNIVTVVMEIGVTTIGDHAFRACKYLTSVIIPNGVTTIGRWAFNNTNIASITIPSSVITIDNQGAFVNCISLTSIDVESENSAYASENGVLFDKNKTTLGCYPAGKTADTYVIPGSVIKIGWFAFAYCESLTSITIPSSVTTIEDFAFSCCESLTSITNLNLVPVEIDPYVFLRENQSICTLTVPTSVVSAYQTAEVWQEFNIVGGGILVNPISSNIEHGYTIGNGLYELNATATVTATIYAGYKFVNWTKNGVEISTDNPYSFTVAEDVELVANFEEEVGIENFELYMLKIYPNPTTGILKIENSGLRIENVTIYDVFGKIQRIENWKMENTIDISHLSAGIYFVKISTEAGEVTKKVLKE